MTKAFDTRTVHAGERRTWDSGKPVVGPIHPSVGYTYADSADLDAVLGSEKAGFVYSSRYGNPTVAALEAAVAELEGAEAAQAYSSGMAAIHAALLAAGVQAGSSVVAAADLYGATYTMLNILFKDLGVEVTFVNILDLSDVYQVVKRAEPVALLVESISNPLMKVADLPQLAGIAHEQGAVLLVDNTFCSPYLCNPVRFGADMVIHSLTKYIAGHGDVMGGMVVTTGVFKDKLFNLNKLIGSSIGPFEAWLALRGLKTLALRMRRQCDSALLIAEWLRTHAKISNVRYAFLRDHAQFELINTLTDGKGGGAVLSFDITNGGRRQVFSFLDALELIQPATSLGDIYSLVLYPTISSHRSLTAGERKRLGIGDGLVRLSVGIEDVDDIKADLDQALAVV